MGKKRLQHNIADLFPDSPIDPDRWSIHGEWTYTNTHTNVHTTHVITDQNDDYTFGSKSRTILLY